MVGGCPLAVGIKSVFSPGLPTSSLLIYMEMGKYRSPSRCGKLKDGWIYGIHGQRLGTGAIKAIQCHRHFNNEWIHAWMMMKNEELEKHKKTGDGVQVITHRRPLSKDRNESHPHMTIGGGTISKAEGWESALIWPGTSFQNMLDCRLPPEHQEKHNSRLHA